VIKIGADKEGWTQYYCTVCGHIEWVAPGATLDHNYHCPLCGEGRSVMIALDDPRLARHRVEFNLIAPRIWQLTKRPPFRADFQHYSYVIAHPEGVILYDAPPFIDDGAVKTILELGVPKFLVVSHTDFVGTAAHWSEVLGIHSLMGKGDSPFTGNRFIPSERVSATRKIFSDVEVVRVPGHSAGSLALYWAGTPVGPALFSGDAITVWKHRDDRTQLAFFQNAPAGEEVSQVASRPVSLLATCGGALKDAGVALRRLCEITDNCGKPYMDDPGGGVWLDARQTADQFIG
jgi:hypothetical protein